MPHYFGMARSDSFDNRRTYQKILYERDFPRAIVRKEGLDLDEELVVKSNRCPKLAC